jgi:hypothetical protein
MQRVKGNEQHHTSERREKCAQKKPNTSLTESALLEMDGNATIQAQAASRSIIGRDASLACCTVVGSRLSRRGIAMLK